MIICLNISKHLEIKIKIKVYDMCIDDIGVEQTVLNISNLDYFCLVQSITALVELRKNIKRKMLK